MWHDLLSADQTSAPAEESQKIAQLWDNICQAAHGHSDTATAMNEFAEHLRSTGKRLRVVEEG